MWDYVMFIHAVDALTIAVRDCKTFFPILVGENSTVLLKKNFYSAYTVGGWTFILDLQSEAFMV